MSLKLSHGEGARGAPLEHRLVTARLEIPARTLARVAIAALLTLATLSLVRSLSDVIVMIVLALVIAVVLSVFVDRLQRRGLGRGTAALITLATALVLVGGLLFLALPPLFTEFRAFFSNLPATAERLRTRLSGNPELFSAIVGKLEELRRDPAGVASGALRVSFSLASSIFAGVLLLTLALYFLLDGERTRATALRLTPAAYRSRVDASLDGAANVIRAYFIGQSIVSAIFAGVTFVLLTVLGVPYALVFAAFAFVLDAIPNIGAMIAMVLPALVALASRGITTAAIVVGVMLVYQQIENNFVQPRVLSRKLNVPPVTTLIAVLVGAKLLGVIGVILAIPLAGMLPMLERIWIRSGETRATA